MIQSCRTKTYSSYFAPFYRFWGIGCVAFFWNIAMVQAQNHQLTILPCNEDTTFSEDVKYQTNHLNANSVQLELQKIIGTLQKKGYWAASIDHFQQEDSTYIACLFVGKKIKWAKLENGNVEDWIIDNIGFRESAFNGKPLSMDKINQLKQRILTFCENNGYPFARVWMGEVQTNEGEISAKLFLDKSKMITISGLKVQGNANISKPYLENYLGIRPNSPYNEQTIQRISSRIRALPFLKETRSLAVVFQGNTAEINLFLEKRNASRFDLIVGFLPRNDFTGRALLTGSFQGVLQNPFGTGKVIGVDWQRLQAETSRLQLNFSYPYILNVPFGFDGKMDIYRRDSTLQDTKFDLGVQYLFEGNNYVKFFWKRIANNTLSVNENQIIATKILPQQLDVQNTTLGIEYAYQQLNNRINPQRGYSIRWQGGAGVKRVIPSTLITNIEDPENPNFDFSSLYDSLNLRTLQLSSELSLAYYIPIKNRVTIKLGMEGGLLYSPDSLYQNEVYRIGGNRILRGFDEESVLASAYVIATLEPRFLLNETSYLFAFWDYAYRQNTSTGNQIADFPMGLGVGLSLSTPAGIVRVSYAIGRQLDNPFDFRAAKIHFGYVSYF